MFYMFAIFKQEDTVTGKRALLKTNLSTFGFDEQ